MCTCSGRLHAFTHYRKRYTVTNLCKGRKGVHFVLVLGYDIITKLLRPKLSCTICPCYLDMGSVRILKVGNGGSRASDPNFYNEYL